MKVLQRIYHDRAKEILIAPDWPSQPFYPRLKELPAMTVTIPPRKTNLSVPAKPVITASSAPQVVNTTGLLSQ